MRKPFLIGVGVAEEISGNDLSSRSIDGLTRRRFLEFLGKTSTAAALTSLLPGVSSCVTLNKNSSSEDPSPSLITQSTLPFTPLEPSSEDAVTLAQGFHYKIIAKWGDVMNAKGEAFGTNNDYLAFFPLNNNGTDGILWVNHEALAPLFVSGYRQGSVKTREQVLVEQLAVGGSLIRIRQDAMTGDWYLVKDDPYNRRLTAQTKIPFAGGVKVQGSHIAIGTLGNCAGGVTPWGTVLTCEENYSDFYGEAVYSKSGSRSVQSSSVFQWEKHFSHPPEHYGWVVEVNPRTGEAHKLTSMGRFCHESATVAVAHDGRCVVYSGDDANDQCLYKFIAARSGSLTHGTLYVANFESSKWVSLDINEQPELKKSFANQLEVLIRAREAAKMVGGTPLARPEDIDIEPNTGAVFVTLTNNVPRGNYYGSILKIEELNGDPLAMSFQHSTFVTGGPESGFACPDNMAFDFLGNLWMTSDISGKAINTAQYSQLKCNGLFYIPMSGELAGEVFRVANAPIEAEFTGPCFSPDGRTLFLSVQHPGEYSKDPLQPSSRWPDQGNSLPKSSVIAISGPALDTLVSRT